MNEIGNVNGIYRTPGRHTTDAPADRAAVDRAATPADRLELSEVGLQMSRVQKVSEIRVEKVARIRAEIEAGRFETADRLDGTISRLLKALSD